MSCSPPAFDDPDVFDAKISECYILNNIEDIFEAAFNTDFDISTTATATTPISEGVTATLTAISRYGQDVNINGFGLNQLFSDAGNIDIRVGDLSDSDQDLLTLAVTELSSDGMSITFDYNEMVSAGHSDSFITYSVTSTLIHEMAHVFHLNGNLGPWEIDNDPTDLSDFEHSSTNHTSLDVIANQLADLLGQVAAAAGDDLVAFPEMNHSDCESMTDL